MSAPHATTTPNRCAPRAPDMSDRNGGRPASRVEPRIAVAIQSAWCFPTAADLASQADRRAGDRLLLARTLHGLRRMGATGIVDNAGSGRCGRRSRTSATTVTPTPLQRNSLQQLAIGCNSTREMRSTWRTPMWDPLTRNRREQDPHLLLQHRWKHPRRSTHNDMHYRRATPAIKESSPGPIVARATIQLPPTQRHD